MDIRYKGISKADIMKIQELHMPRHSLPPTSDKFEWSQFDVAEISGIKRMIDDIVEKEDHNRDIYLICEMAKLYLDTIKDKKCCKTCRWHDDFSWVCFNPESEKRADFTDNGYCCECWEEKKE